jgi:uncharacterized protein (DUF3084 family)
MISENENIRIGLLQKEKEAVLVQANLDKINNEKNVLSASSTQLEKRVTDLSAQKELFTAVIESLTKKADEVDVVKKEEPKPL